MLRKPNWRALLRGSVSHRAMALRMAGGFNPRAVIWFRKIETSPKA